jgi:hypothetical protein
VMAGIGPYVENPSGCQHGLALLFDRALTDAEMVLLTSSAFRSAIAAGL